MKSSYLTPATQAIEISTVVIMGPSTQDHVAGGGGKDGDWDGEWPQLCIAIARYGYT